MQSPESDTVMFNASGRTFVFLYLIRMKSTKMDISFTSRKLHDINNNVAYGETDGS